MWGRLRDGWIPVTTNIMLKPGWRRCTRRCQFLSASKKIVNQFLASAHMNNNPEEVGTLGHLLVTAHISLLARQRRNQSLLSWPVIHSSFGSGGCEFLRSQPVVIDGVTNKPSSVITNHGWHGIEKMMNFFTAKSLIPGIACLYFLVIPTMVNRRVNRESPSELTRRNQQ